MLDDKYGDASTGPTDLDLVLQRAAQVSPALVMQHPCCMTNDGPLMYQVLLMPLL